MRLTTFLALGAIVSVDLSISKDPKKRNKKQKDQNQRQAKQCVQKEWSFPERGGRLTQIVTHLSKICKGYIDRPTYQCRCLKRQKTLFWSLVKSRRVCISRKREAERHAEKKKNKDEKNKNKSRKRREEDEEDMVDLSMLMDDNEDVQDSEAGQYLETEASLADAMEAGHNITQDEMSTLVSDTCDVDDDSEDAEEECSTLRQAADDLRANGEDEDVKERAEIIYRITRMHRAMGNWAQTYIADGNYCDKQAKMMKRISKNRRRMQRKRLAYPTNPLKLKKKRQQMRAKEQAKKEKQAAKAQN